MKRRGFLQGLGVALGGLVAPALFQAARCPSCGQNAVLELPDGSGWACARCGRTQPRRGYSFGRSYEISLPLEGSDDAPFSMSYWVKPTRQV